jgi:hypothetical protein
MPLPPVFSILDLDDLLNRLFRKIGRQAERQKTITVIQGNSSDGKHIVEASDGDTIKTNNPEAAKEIRFGGPDQINMAFMTQCRQYTSLMAGNLDTMAGLSPLADTVGQERILVEGSNVRIKYMEDRFYAFTKRVVRDLALYLWEDDFIEIPFVKRVPGTDIEIPCMWNEESRKGYFFDYNFEIEPFSMQPQGPGQIVQAVDSIVFNTIMPLLPVLADQGVTINFEGLLRLKAEALGLKELDQFVSFSGPPKALRPEIINIGSGGTPKRALESQQKANALQQQGGVGAMEHDMISAGMGGTDNKVVA